MSANGIRLANEVRLASERRARTIGGIALEVDYQEVALAHVGRQPIPLKRYLKDSDNSDSVEMRVDGSTPVNFDMTPASGEILRIEKLVLVMVLTASPTMVQFGDQAALSNGLTLKVLDNDDAVVVDLLDDEPVLSNNDLATVGELTPHLLGSSYTLKTVIVPASPIRLEETATGEFEKLRLTVSDDLSASTITRMRMLAFGRLESSLT
jgi:hypothetical protein